MNRSNVKLLLLISILLLSNVFVTNIASADTHVLPKLGEGESLTIDGDITSPEWDTSVTFTTELHDQETSVFVTTNATHLFIGFNISSSIVTVNDNVPSDPNYDLGYNNETHDWFAVVLDNNLDKAVTPSVIGTSAQPDDVVVIDQYTSGAYDAFANGSATFVPDATEIYSGEGDTTTVAGNGGTNDVSSARLATSQNVSYEIVKPLAQEDDLGNDFLLDDLGIMQFSIFQWTNSQANDTLSSGDADNTDWFSLRINDSGTGLSTQAPSNTTVNVIANGVDEGEFDAVQTLSELYGFELSISATVAETDFEAYDLNILVMGDEAALTADELTSISDYMRTGGNLVTFLGASGASVDVADLFELDYLRNSVLVPGDEDGDNDTLTLSASNEVPLDNEVLTNRTADNLELTSSALNTTEVKNETNKFVFDQEFMVYDLFTVPSDAAYDQSNDQFINATESFNGLSLGVAFDFLKSGRASIFPSNFVTDGVIPVGDNLVYLLQMLPWNSRIVNTLDITSTDTDKRTVDEGGAITVTVNMTDGLGEVVDNATVQVEVVLAGSVIKTVDLTQVGDTSTYEGEVVFDQNGFIELEITGFSQGNGFSEGETADVFVEAKVGSFNDLSELSIIIIALFGVSLVALFVVYTRVRAY